MTLLKIYRCFCDETRLRILHLLSLEPLVFVMSRNFYGFPKWLFPSTSLTCRQMD